MGEIAARIADANDDARATSARWPDMDKVGAAFRDREIKLGMHRTRCLDHIDLAYFGERGDRSECD